MFLFCYENVKQSDELFLRTVIVDEVIVVNNSPIILCGSNVRSIKQKLAI